MVVMEMMEATMDGLCHEQSKMKDNERTDKDLTHPEFAVVNNNMVVFKTKMVQVNQTTNERNHHTL